MIATRSDAKRAHQRGVQRSDISFHHVLGHPFLQQIGRSSLVSPERLFLAVYRLRQRRSCVQVRSHQQGFENAHGRTRRGDALVAARSHPREGKGRTHEPSRESIHLAHIVERIVTYRVRVVHIGLVHARAFDIHAFG